MPLTCLACKCSPQRAIESLGGRWSQVDPTYVPKYADFFFMLSDEKIDQQRMYLTIFDMFEALGGTLTKLTKDQAEYIGVDVDGPYKPEHYRY